MGAATMQNLKGHPVNHTKNSAKARRYAVMLLLAFTAAVIGVMLLHMFRERRVFSILLKDKDAQIITLQILLQKERDHAKQVKHKTDDFKLKINSLRSRKLALHAKLMEMQSLFSSIKEERKALESLIEEKQGEINLLRQQQQQPELARSDDDITSQALDKNNHGTSMDFTSQAEYPPNVNNPSNSIPVNSNQDQNVVVNRELGSESLKSSTIESTEPDHDLIQGGATALDAMREEESNNQAHGTEGGGDPEEIAATKLESATMMVDAGAKASGTRHGNRRSRHSKEKRWKMLLKSRRSQAAGSRDGAGAVDVDNSGKLDRQLQNDDQAKLSSSTTALNDVELSRRDENGGDESTGADADEQRLIGKGEQSTFEERAAAGSEENNNSIKPDKTEESVVTEDIKEGRKDQEELKQEGGGDDDHHQEEEEVEPEF